MLCIALGERSGEASASSEDDVEAEFEGLARPLGGIYGSVGWNWEDGEASVWVAVAWCRCARRGSRKVGGVFENFESSLKADRSGRDTVARWLGCRWHWRVEVVRVRRLAGTFEGMLSKMHFTIRPHRRHMMRKQFCLQGIRCRKH